MQVNNNKNYSSSSTLSMMNFLLMDCTGHLLPFSAFETNIDLYNGSMAVGNFFYLSIGAEYFTGRETHKNLSLNLIS
jgi:hypothetical protein